MGPERPEDVTGQSRASDTGSTYTLANVITQGETWFGVIS